MSADRWKMVKGLFQRALALPPAEWEEYLDRVCAGDADLRSRVHELLSEHRAESGVLAAGTTASGPRAGTTVDSTYVLVRSLGDGSDGSAWLARHIVIGDNVVLRFPHADSRADEWLSRRAREARIARRLQQPLIAAIHDVRANSDFFPYMVREFLDGKTLNEVLSTEAPHSVAWLLEALEPIAPLYDKMASIGESLRIGLDSIVASGSQNAPGTQLRLLSVGRSTPGDDAEPETSSTLSFGATASEAVQATSQLSSTTSTAASVRGYASLVRQATTGMIPAACVGVRQLVAAGLAGDASFPRVGEYAAALRRAAI